MPTRRTVLRFLGVIVLLQFTFHYFLPSTNEDMTSPIPFPQHNTTSHASFLHSAMEMFLKAEPQGIEPLEITSRAPSFFYRDVPGEPFTAEFLSKYLIPSEKQLTELTSKHNQLKQDILNITLPTGAFSGKGIVVIGGGTFMGTALTSIKALREAGSRLPLELMLTNKEEYDGPVCEVLLPQLNARCRVMEDILTPRLFSRINPQRYELKVLGLFLSSFEEVLLLDADNIPIRNPDYILQTSKPYRSTGYVLWPDFWRQTISPHFYTITNTTLGEPVRKDGVKPLQGFPSRDQAQLSDLDGAIPDSTNEAGQLAIHKTNHIRALLATVYYNLYGFKYYYHLLGQGAVGVGDKDTFIAGLTVFKEPFYLVKARPGLLGYKHLNGWQDTTMLQYDPQQDWNWFHQVRKFLKRKGVDILTNLALNDDITNNLREEIACKIKIQPEVQFLHVHSPKFNAKANHVNNDYTIDGLPRRQFGAREDIKDELPRDWELWAFRMSEWLACEAPAVPKDWNDLPRAEICERVRTHVEWLRSTSDMPWMGELKSL